MEEIEEQDDRECDDDRGEPEPEDVADIMAGHCRPGQGAVCPWLKCHLVGIPPN